MLPNGWLPAAASPVKESCAAMSDSRARARMSRHGRYSRPIRGPGTVHNYRSALAEPPSRRARRRLAVVLPILIAKESQKTATSTTIVAVVVVITLFALLVYAASRIR